MPIEKVILIVGNSQTCKSSIVNLLGGNSAIGSGNGISCTNKTNMKIINNCPLFPKQTVMIIDTVGFYGTDLNTVEQIIEDIKTFLLTEPGLNTIDAILLTECASDSVIQLQNTYQSLIVNLKTEIQDNCILVLTKSNLVQQQILYLRIQALNQLIQKFQISGGIVDFQTIYQINVDNQQQQIMYQPSEEQKKYQFQQLMIAINKVKKFSLKEEIDLMEQNIQQIIAQLKQKIFCKATINVEAQKVQLVEKTQTKTYQLDVPIKTEKNILGIPIGHKIKIERQNRQFTYQVQVPIIKNEVEKRNVETLYEESYYRKLALEEYKDQLHQKITAALKK